MGFWPRWRATEPSSGAEREALRLLDLAYLAVLPPLLPLLKLPMLLFTLLAAGLALFKGRLGTPGLVLLGLAGAAAIFLSLYGAFNFVGLSRLRLFVELLLYLLVLAVALQRLTGKVNLYLVLSPLLFLALSLFFYQSLPMLLYIVPELFVLLWLAVTWYMRTTPRKSLRTAATLFLFSLPVVVLLFLFFPRISFGHASFGFRGEGAVRTTLDGSMRLDAGALGVLSRRIVMEVGFEGKIPPESALYFRGSVLYLDKGDHWEPLPPFVRRAFPPVRYAGAPMVEEASDIVAYKVSLYPTRKKWLYLLDLPIEAPEGALIDADFEVTLKKPADKPQIYSGGSALRYRYGARTAPEVLRHALAADAARNPRCAEEAAALAAKFPDGPARLRAIEARFRDAGLTYTLEPPTFDTARFADDFLYDKKAGYCVHFAAAFATFCRLAKLPARIVTGYKGNRANSVENYVAVEERDAHAWVEVYVDRHWRRVETTAFAAHVSGDPATRALLGRTPARNGRKGEKAAAGALSRFDLYLLYARFKAETWILRYSRYRQMQLLEKAKKDPLFVAKFAGALALLALLAWGTAWYLRRPVCGEPALCLFRRLRMRLEKMGCAKRESETVHAYLTRCAEDPRFGEALRRIDRLYHEARYGEKKESLQRLEKEIGDFLKRLKRRDRREFRR